MFNLSQFVAKKVFAFCLNLCKMIMINIGKANGAPPVYAGSSRFDSYPEFSLCTLNKNSWVT